MAKNDHIAGECVEQALADGIAFIEEASPLTRLHYFDGQYLRADAFAREQDYLRARNRLSNLAGGWGVVHGLGIALAGDTLSVTPGLAITPAGNPVLAVGTLSAAIAELVGVAAAAPLTGMGEFGDCVGKAPAGKVTPAQTIYEITVGPVETLCGNESVYGKLCATACASDTRHPWWREGVALRLRPISPQLASSPFAQGNAYLRNRVASAYFAAEPWLTPPALSGAGLASDLWCQPAGLYGRDEVPIGLLVREGGVTRVLDAWSARRERMDSQARGYWQGRMMMRPWNVFLAQILQFQCQLAATFEAGGVIGPVDECGDLRVALDRARRELEALGKKYAASTGELLASLGDKPSKTTANKLALEMKGSWAELLEVSNALARIEVGGGALPKNRMLLLAGFAELPPAGYLPVATGGAPVAEQVARMFGEGVRLTFRAARADVLPHLLEQARDMNRISLTRGLENPDHPEDVEVFVPDGAVGDAALLATGTWWRVDGDAMMAFELLGMALEESGEQMDAHTGGGDAQVREKAQAALQMRRAESLLPALSGLAHSGARAEGGYGATLVAAPEALEIAMVLGGMVPVDIQLTPAVAEVRVERSDNAYLEPVAREATVMRRQLSALYLSGDIDADPFDLGVGAETGCRVEARVAITRGDVMESGVAAYFQGALTVISRRSLPSGHSELQVEARLTGSVTSHTPGAPPEVRADTPQPLRFALLRRGDAREGALILDDRLFNPLTPALQLDWSGAPQVLNLFALLAAVGGGDDVAKAFAAANAGMQVGIALADRVRLANAEALSAAPSPVGGIGGAAMGTLSRLADFGNDAAFLARARRRLFPHLDQPALPVVKAVRDWVMFRQRRPGFCDPACVGEGAVGVDAFQVWHLCVDPEALPRLAAALAKNDAQALAAFPFTRVGVLRYQHESQQPEETPAHVRALWRLAQPCARVALARVWENDPGTGQGWQNHFRLRGMLDAIAPLTEAPPQGGGVVGTLPRAPAPLADSALDGGMLVVTTGTIDTEVRLHAAVLLSYELLHKYLPALKQTGGPAWNELRQMDVVETMTLRFGAGVPHADDVATLRAAVAHAERQSSCIDLTYAGTCTLVTLLLTTAAFVQGAGARHAQIIGAIQASVTGLAVSDQGSVVLPDGTDMGPGVEGVSLLALVKVPNR